MLSKEYPPEIYGGAGVHVAELVRALRARADLETRVHAFGAPRDEPLTSSYADLAELARRQRRAADARASTWRSRTAAPAPTSCTRTPGTPTSPATSPSLLYGVPHVVTAHSLEPLRPWKAEQLGGGYAVSSWVERTSYLAAAAVIAVSAAMRDDVLRVATPTIDPARVHVVHNGIDTEDWSPVARPRPGARARRRPRPAVGRVRRPDHPPEGPAALPARGRAAAARGPDRALRRRPGHPGDPGRGRGARRLARGVPRRRRLDPRDAARGPTWSRCSPRRPRSPARRSTSRSASSTSRRWPARPPSSPPPPAASPRSSCPARPGCWCRSSRPPTAPARRSTPSSTSPTSPPRSTRSSPTPTGPPRWAGPVAQRAIESFSWPAIAEKTVEVYRSVLPA